MIEPEYETVWNGSISRHQAHQATFTPPVDIEPPTPRRTRYVPSVDARSRVLGALSDVWQTREALRTAAHVDDHGITELLTQLGAEGLVCRRTEPTPGRRLARYRLRLPGEESKFTILSELEAALTDAWQDVPTLARVSGLSECVTRSRLLRAVQAGKAERRAVKDPHRAGYPRVSYRRAR